MAQVSSLAPLFLIQDSADSLYGKIPEDQSHACRYMRVDSKTGQRLDENYNVVINEIQKVYTQFESLDLAIEAINTTILEKANIEFIIYDCHKNALKFIRDISRV